jgi:hypothetical protein
MFRNVNTLISLFLKMACVASLIIGLITLPNTGFASDRPLSNISVGLRFGPNANLLSEVEQEHPNPVYPGFFGTGWFLGGGINYTALGVVSLCFELLYSVESATGSMEFEADMGNDRDEEESLFILEGHRLHIPLYLKLQVPRGMVRPFIAAGLDFVVKSSNDKMRVEPQGDARECQGNFTNPGGNCDPYPQEDYQVNPIDDTLFLLFSLGIELNFEPVRIPLELRLLLNPSIGDFLSDRTSVQPRQGERSLNIYDNEWHYQIFLLLGADYQVFEH